MADTGRSPEPSSRCTAALTGKAPVPLVPPHCQLFFLYRTEVQRDTGGAEGNLVLRRFRLYIHQPARGDKRWIFYKGERRRSS